MQDNELFTAKNSGFWGFLSALSWLGYAVVNYLKANKTKESEKELARILEEKTMEEKKGIKETKEVLMAAKVLSLLIIKKAKDGIQVSDGVDIAAALLLDAEIKGAVSAALEKINEVPAEMKDLDILEGMDLAKFVLDSIPEYIEALKK